MNIQVQRKSHRSPASGDIFQIQSSTGHVIRCQVLATDQLGMGAIAIELDLVYSSNGHQVPILFTNTKGWRDGYFLTLRQEHVSMNKIKGARFCDELRHMTVDMSGRPIGMVGHLLLRNRQVGPWGLVSIAYIDDIISDALGIPRAPLSDG
jgi:hypothetical protein